MVISINNRFNKDSVEQNTAASSPSSSKGSNDDLTNNNNNNNNNNSSINERDLDVRFDLEIDNVILSSSPVINKDSLYNDDNIIVVDNSSIITPKSLNDVVKFDIDTTGNATGAEIDDDDIMQVAEKRLHDSNSENNLNCYVE
jgi:hypothetical protein